ncbi:uncharacterized protein DDB_G0287625-like [Condylostylus longicornis]|uniref:uncharacterized protein DDB_G0287625-like n=1 Tax=Condylostylus longicornis TaxID=2530218 RepID=UPI00244E1981|nr:uncharacterized protein DDB_G0287625-like [Condylostylus longicornis]
MEEIQQNKKEENDFNVEEERHSTTGGDGGGGSEDLTEKCDETIKDELSSLLSSSPASPSSKRNTSKSLQRINNILSLLNQQPSFNFKRATTSNINTPISSNQERSNNKKKNNNNINNNCNNNNNNSNNNNNNNKNNNNKNHSITSLIVRTANISKQLEEVIEELLAGNTESTKFNENSCNSNNMYKKSNLQQQLQKQCESEENVPNNIYNEFQDNRNKSNKI